MSTDIPLDKIHLNPYQMWPIDPAHVAALAADLREHTQLQPGLARPHPDQPGHVQLAFGHHRRAALAALGQPTMAVDVRLLTDLELADFAIVENFQRRTPTALDKARALQRLTSPPFNLTQADAGKRFGYRDQASVSNLLKLLKLPKPVQASVEAGELPERFARQLVGLSEFAPKDAERIAQAIAEAPAPARQDTFTKHMAYVLKTQGRDLLDAAFDLQWLTTPVPVEHPANGQPAELRACAGCPALFHSDEHGDYCTQPGCFDLKQARFLSELLARTSERLGLPAAGPDEKAVALYDRHDYRYEASARKLVSAAQKNPALGLRLVAVEHAPYWARNVFGSDHLALASVNATAVRAFLTAGAPATQGRAATSGAKPPTAAQIEKQRLQYEELREERRLERAARQRVEQDVIWLVKNYAQIVGDQLAISGGVLAYVVGRLLHSNRQNRQQASRFYGLLDWYDALEKQGAIITGGDPTRRRQLVAAEVFEHALPWAGPNATNCWKTVTERLAALASSEPSRGVYGDRKRGFDVKLPTGWDKPPVHTTEYNCHHCGAFAGGNQRKLSKKDLESGWSLTMDGKQVKDVTCPHCGEAARKTTERGWLSAIAKAAKAERAAAAKPATVKMKSVVKVRKAKSKR